MKFHDFRVCLFSLDEQRQIKHIQNSGMLRSRLRRNIEVSCHQDNLERNMAHIFALMYFFSSMK